MVEKSRLRSTKLLHRKCDLNILSKLDPTTFKHSINVACYATRFAKAIDSNIKTSFVYYSGLYHDIGKAKIDKNILNKPSKLTNEEFDLIKTHPNLGYSMLAKSGLPERILQAIKYHHERFDGKGYPDGLNSDKIPLMVRIISLCDVFDALTSDRPYRKGYCTNQALKTMSKMTGHFDPELFERFLCEIPNIIFN